MTTPSCKMLLLASVFNINLVLKGRVPLIYIFSIRGKNFLGNQGELLYASMTELNLLSLHPEIFAAVSVSSLFSLAFVALCCTILYFLDQNERLAQDCSGCLYLLRLNAVGEQGDLPMTFSSLHE